VAGFEGLFGGAGEEGDGPGLEPEDPTDVPPPEGADRPLCRALVEEALGRLAARDRTVLRLYHVEGRSYEEIAAFLRCSVKAVGPRLTRARERFRRALHPEARP
jgi:RNA polymerase sigma-70 factor (ECF subfamily)